MDILQTKTDQEILQSLLAEIAKATGEIRCARGDIEKAQSRIKFTIVLINELLDRKHV